MGEWVFIQEKSPHTDRLSSVQTKEDVAALKLVLLELETAKKFLPVNPLKAVFYFTVAVGRRGIQSDVWPNPLNLGLVGANTG